MNTKTKSVKVIPVADSMGEVRRVIKACQRILDKFGTDEGFDEFCEKDTITLTVGTDEASLYFSPQTWEAAERFLMHCITHLIENDREYFDQFPYYRELADRYAAALGAEREDFE